MDTSDIYNPSFAHNYKKLFNQTFQNGFLLQTVHIGESHAVASSAAGKIFTWGLNDQGQLGRGEEKSPKRHKPYPLNFPHRLKQISVGANHTLAITTQGQLYGWGSNSLFQLDYETNLPFCTPKLLDYFDNESVTYIKATKNVSFAITSEGRVFTWPVSDSFSFLPNPIELSVPQSISRVSCGSQFAILLSINGVMYAFGENDHGQLGLGDNEMRVQPQQIQFAEKVLSVQCGQKHSACFTSLHRLFTWGWGEHGQLGTGAFKDLLAPQNVHLGNFFSIACGARSTIFIVQNRRIQWCGTNGTISYQNTFIDFKVEAKCPLLALPHYSPIRVLSSYSQSLSIIYLTYAQHKGMWDRNPQYSRGVIQQIANKWVESDNQIDPPYIENIAKHISEKHLRKSDKLNTKKSNYFHQPNVAEFQLKSKSEIIQPPTFSNLLDNSQEREEKTLLESKKSELKLKSPPQSIKVDDIIKKQLTSSEPYSNFNVLNSHSDHVYKGYLEQNQQYRFEQISDHSDEYNDFEVKNQSNNQLAPSEILIEENEYHNDQQTKDGKLQQQSVKERFLFDEPNERVNNFFKNDYEVIIKEDEREISQKSLKGGEVERSNKKLRETSKEKQQDIEPLSYKELEQLTKSKRDQLAKKEKEEEKENNKQKDKPKKNEQDLSFSQEQEEVPQVKDKKKQKKNDQDGRNRNKSIPKRQNTNQKPMQKSGMKQSDNQQRIEKKPQQQSTTKLSQNLAKNSQKMKTESFQKPKTNYFSTNKQQKSKSPLRKQESKTIRKNEDLPKDARMKTEESSLSEKSEEISQLSKQQKEPKPSQGEVQKSQLNNQETEQK